MMMTMIMAGEAGERAQSRETEARGHAQAAEPGAGGGRGDAEARQEVHHGQRLQGVHALQRPAPGGVPHQGRRPQLAAVGIFLSSFFLDI